MVVDHGTIIAIGTDADILNGFAEKTERVNLRQKTIWPGLTDAHVHLQHLADSLAIVDCETDTLDECLARILQAARKLPENAWVRGHGWNQNRWQEGYGTAEMLDAVCGGRPAYLTAKSLHAAWVNQKAMHLAGIDDRTPDPPEGLLQKDELGHLTGILFEAGAMALIEQSIPPETQPALIKKFKTMMPDLWKLGLVGVHDFDGIECWKALQELHQSGELKLRVRKNVPRDHLDTFIKAGFRTDDGDDWLNIGSVKLFADGALGPQTAAMLEPFENSDDTGTLLMSQDEIEEIGHYAASHGFSLAIHAIGDRANRTVINAFQNIRQYEQDHTLPHLRHRIEHVQILDPSDFTRLSELDLIASVQPIHAPSDMAMADKYLGKRAENSYAYKSLIDHGVWTVFGSDSPVEPINPFLGIHAAVTRRNQAGLPGEAGWHPDQRLSLQDALDGFSSRPADISQRGARLGKIAPGYSADFIILNHDPFSIHPHELATVKPIATLIGGDCVYQTEMAQIA